MCFTDARIWNENSLRFASKTFCETYSQENRKHTVFFNDMATGHWIPTGSVVYRRTLFDSVPTWLDQIPMADWGLFLALLNKGPGIFLNECTSVYRVHGSSYWSSLTQEERQDGAFRFLQVMKNQFGFINGKAMHQRYWFLCSEKYRRMDGLRNWVLWFYYRAMQKIWRVLFLRKTESDNI